MRGSGSISSGFILVLLAAALTLSAAASAPAPRIQFDQSSFDFGTMFQEESVGHEFVVRNTGDAPLKIDKVTTSCGCTAALPTEQEIATGKTAAIKVTFRSGRMRDRVTKYIYVESSDPLQPRATLTITGIVKREVEVTPSSVVFGNVKIGEVVERAVLIRPVDVKSFRILDVKSEHKAVHVDRPEAIKDKQGGYRLRVRLGPLSQPERVYTTILVHTDLEHTKDLRITLYGKVGQQQTRPAPSTR